MFSFGFLVVTYATSDQAFRLTSTEVVRIILATFAVILIALLFRLGLITRPPEPDEYLHVLSARGWLETGRPTILDGEYTRGIWFTAPVAWLFSITGTSSFETGRALTVLGSVLIPAVLFLWLRVRIGWLAGFIGAALVIMWPQGIIEAQTVRFYSWHCLFFLIGAIAAFETVEAPGIRRAMWAVLGVISFIIAFQLQITTAIGLLAVLSWIAAMLFLPIIWRQPKRWLWLGALLAAGIAVIVFLVSSGLMAQAWAEYRWTPVWNEHRKDQVTFYNSYLRNTYPTLWPLFPLAALLSFRFQPRLTAFCVVVFSVILLGQSFGGMKADRYLSYGMPFLFAVFAIAAAAILPAAADAVMRAADVVNPTRARWVSSALVVVALLFAGMMNPFFGRSVDAVAGKHPSSRPEPDWSRLPALIGDWTDAPFVLTTRAMHTTFALGDFDVTYSPTTMSELPEKSEFSLDPRNGRPVVGELKTIAAILRCQPEGLLVSNNRFWSAERQDEWMPLFEAAGHSIEIRERRQLFALYWTGGTSDVSTCATLPL